MSLFLNSFILLYLLLPVEDKWQFFISFIFVICIVTHRRLMSIFQFLYFVISIVTRRRLMSVYHFLVNINGFSPNLVCALILWRSGLGLLMGKFRQFLTELSAPDTPIFWFPDDNE